MPVPTEEVHEKFGVIHISNITIDDLYYQIMDHIHLVKPHNKNIIFEKCNIVFEI